MFRTDLTLSGCDKALRPLQSWLNGYGTVVCVCGRGGGGGGGAVWGERGREGREERGGERERERERERWGIRVRVKELHTQKSSKHVMYIHV